MGDDELARDGERATAETERPETEADRPAPEAERPGDDADRPPSDGSPDPVAYRVPMETALRLDQTNASRVIERSPVVARSGSGASMGLVVSQWLEARGVRLTPPRVLLSVLERVATRQELALIVVTSAHQRFADALERQDPAVRELRSFYRGLIGTAPAGAGQEMLDWLRVYRRAMKAADEGHVVFIPVLG